MIKQLRMIRFRDFLSKIYIKIISNLWGSPQSVIAFMRILMHFVFPAPLGPRAIIPCRTLCVSNN